jgi:hypothetical protein
MSERIRYLERQVEEEREARRRADTLLARLMDQLPQLEAPRDDRERREPSDQEPESTESRTEQAEPQRSAERPWWQRMFGR